MHRSAITGCLAVAAIAAAGTTAANASSSHGRGATAASSSAAATARKDVQPYIAKPSPFPVTQKLLKDPKGKVVDYMSSGNPFDEVLYAATVPAAKMLGIKLKQIVAGTSASTITAGFDAAVNSKPAGVIVPGTDPELWASDLAKLKAAKIPVVASAILDGAKYGIPYVEGGAADDRRSGKLMAEYAYGELDSSSNAKFVVYSVPEVPAIGAVAAAFTAKLKQLCPGCQSRTVQISAATLGSTAANTVVSDLQSHSGTNVAVFADDEIELGLPAALKAAKITIKTLGYAPTPTNLEYLKQGQETAVLADDAAVSAWQEVDLIAREITGQKVTGYEAAGFSTVQFLTSKQVTFNPAKGFSAYPRFATTFAKLWGVKG